MIAGSEAKPSRFKPDDQMLLQAPCSLTRCRGVLRAVLSAQPQDGNSRDPVLIKAVVRAHHWADLLASGEVDNQRSLAGKVGWMNVT